MLENLGTLRSLERDGLVTRRVYAQVPPRVEYGPTPPGPLRQWAGEHVEQVRAAYAKAETPAGCGAGASLPVSPIGPRPNCESCDLAKKKRPQPLPLQPTPRTAAPETMDSLFNYFDHFLRLSPESKALIAAQVELENVKKGEFLWKAGQRCSKLYFMQAGIARLFFYNEAGEENTVHFVSANKFMADLESLNAKTPSSVSCVAAADCAVLTISCSALEKLNNEVFEWHELLRKITEKSLFDKIKVRDSIFKKEAKERYVAFLAQFPTIAGSVPANHIASYLGISPFTLSHLKKELANSDFLRISKN